MRTDVVGPFKGSLKGSKLVVISPLVPVEISLPSIPASGSASSTQKAPGMLNRIFTSISERLSSYLSSSSRAAKLLSVSYWTCMVLSCIAFFIFPWYLFLAFLTPALIMLFIREVHKISQACSDYKGPA